MPKTMLLSNGALPLYSLLTFWKSWIHGLAASVETGR